MNSDMMMQGEGLVEGEGWEVGVGGGEVVTDV